MNNQFLKIPFLEIADCPLFLSAEVKVYFYIRGLEESAGFYTGELSAHPIGICIKKESTLGEDLGLTKEQVKKALNHLQYRYGLGARVWAEIDQHKAIEKHWCSTITIKRLYEAGMIYPSDEKKVKKLMSDRI